jgi:D-lactate dehydrogenase
LILMHLSGMCLLSSMIKAWTDDSYSALKSGHIAAVGLDVYERESSYFFADSSAKVIADDTFARLLSFYNVFMT